MNRPLAIILWNSAALSFGIGSPFPSSNNSSDVGVVAVPVVTCDTVGSFVSHVVI